MLKKNIKPVLLAGALALATAVSPVMATQVDNGDGTTTPTLTDCEFKKVLSFADGVSLDADVTFGYTVNFDNTNSDYIENAPTVELDSVTFNKDNQIDTNDTLKGIQLSQTGNIAISLIRKDGKILTKPGVYVYTIYENATPNTNTNPGTFTNDSNRYRLRVYVENTDNGIGIAHVTVIKLKKDAQGNYSEEDTTTGKQESLVFNNSYNKNITKDALKVEKDIAGNQADLTKKFTFDITLTLPSGATGTFNCKDKNGNVVNPRSTNNNVITYQVQLADDEYVKWDILPAGTTYIVTEIGDEDRYTPSYAGKEGGESFNSSTDNSITESSDVTVSKTVKDSGKNSLKFTNTYKDSPLTGVIVNNMPYIALLGASGAGLVVLAASKKRSKK